MKKPTVVLGLGNPLMADEGIGIHLVNCLSELSEKFPHVDFIDAGTGGLSLLHYFEGRQKAVIIDCAEMGAEPGAVRKFRPDQVESIKKLTHYSLHEQDLIKIIEMARKLNQCPPELIIFGVQPEMVSLEQQISSVLVERMDEYITLISREL
ncbi:MAG: hydrogenase maturation protease [Sedimentisphaerales bacterium]|nr:hydrogenase maturation protease [Sedimentisphaerales bacterium]